MKPLGVEAKIWETSPKHPFVHRVFHYINHPFWGFSIPLFLVQHPYLLMFFSKRSDVSWSMIIELAQASGVDVIQVEPDTCTRRTPPVPGGASCCSCYKIVMAMEHAPNHFGFIASLHVFCHDLQMFFVVETQIRNKKTLSFRLKHSIIYKEHLKCPPRP